MAGKIIVSTLQSDTDNSISFVANTGATIFSANLSNGIAGSFIGAGSITGDKIGATAINANNIVNASITGAKLAANTVTGDVIGQNAISSNNIVSVNASVATVGTLPKARLPTGSVLQVVRSDYTTTTSTTNTSSWTNIGSATITPQSTSNKILITASYHSSGIGAMRLLRGSTALNTPTNTYMAFDPYASSNQAAWNAGSPRQIITMVYYDSPSTTSSTTYNIEMIAYSIGGTTGFGVNELHSGIALSGITLMEIVA